MSTSINAQRFGRGAPYDQRTATVQAGERQRGARIASAAPATSTSSSSSATVSLSAAGLQLLQGTASAVADIAKGATGMLTQAVELPFDLASDAAHGIASAVVDAGKAAQDLVSGQLAATASDVGAIGRDLFIDLPAAAGSDIAKDAKAGLADAMLVAHGLGGLASLGLATGTTNATTTPRTTGG